MTILKNFWVQKRYQILSDNEWMLFCWGFPAASMLAALEQASKKSHTELTIHEESEKYWRADDKEGGKTYIVEMRDDKPQIHEGKNVVVRDQTMAVNPEKKRMPVAGTLFKQPDLF
jgi:hypothetical protein